MRVGTILLAFYLAGASSSLAGCSLLNKPDAGLIGGPDAGRDVGPVDGSSDALDARVDAMGDAGPDAGPPEVCDDRLNEDEDGNGLANCADYACAGEEQCCDEGEVAPYDYDPSGGLGWTASGSPGVDGGSIDFDNLGGPHAIVTSECVPLAQGAVFNQEFGFDGNAAADFAALILSSVDAAPVEQRVNSDLSVTVFGDRRVEVRVGGVDGDVVEAEIDISSFGDDPFDLALRVAPVTLRDGIPRLTVSGTFSQLGTDVTFDLGPILFADSDALLDGCFLGVAEGEGLPGLHFGIEGNGPSVTARRNMTVETLSCSNPSLFEESGALNVLTSQPVPGESSLEWDTGEIGGMRWPALLKTSPEDDEWTVAASVSEQDPNTENITADFPWRVERSDTAGWNQDEWEPRTSPLVANASQPSITFTETVVRQDNELVLLPDVPLVTPEPGDELLHPALAIQGSGIAERYVLFYVLKRDNQFSIRQNIWDPGRGESEWDQEVLAAEVLGDDAAGGIEDLAVLLDEVDDGNTILVRMWILGQRSSSETRVLLATAQYKVAEVGMGFSMTPYPANPIGSASSLLGPNAALRGLAVARESPSTLRFLLSRRLDLDGGGDRWDFVPLQQVWGLLEAE